MTLYFAYGSNMQRAAMQTRCPGARAIGPAKLDSHRFFIGVDGWGSVRLSPGDTVHGILWRLTPRDLAALNLFENLDSGLYRRAMFTVEAGGKRARALIYVGGGGGRPRPAPGYQERVIASAADWRMPQRYLAELRRFAPGYRGARPAETGEIA